MSWVLSSVQQYRWQCRLCWMHSVNVGYNDYMSHRDSAINDTGDRVLPVTQWQLNSAAYYLPDATYYDRASRWHGTSVAMLHSRMFFLMYGWVTPAKPFKLVSTLDSQPPSIMIHFLNDYVYNIMQWLLWLPYFWHGWLSVIHFSWMRWFRYCVSSKNSHSLNMLSQYEPLSPWVEIIFHWTSTSEGHGSTCMGVGHSHGYKTPYIIFGSLLVVVVLYTSDKTLLNMENYWLAEPLGSTPGVQILQLVFDKAWHRNSLIQCHYTKCLGTTV